jgi:hypothetical protein
MNFPQFKKVYDYIGEEQIVYLIEQKGKRITERHKKGVPMVGSTFCKTNCPHYKGTMRLLFWKFVKCSYLY